MQHCAFAIFGYIWSILRAFAVNIWSIFFLGGRGSIFSKPPLAALEE